MHLTYKCEIHIQNIPGIDVSKSKVLKGAVSMLSYQHKKLLVQKIYR